MICSSGIVGASGEQVGSKWQRKAKGSTRSMPPAMARSRSGRRGHAMMGDSDMDLWFMGEWEGGRYIIPHLCPGFALDLPRFCPVPTFQPALSKSKVGHLQLPKFQNSDFEVPIKFKPKLGSLGLPHSYCSALGSQSPAVLVFIRGILPTSSHFSPSYHPIGTKTHPIHQPVWPPDFYTRRVATLY